MLGYSTELLSENQDDLINLRTLLEDEKVVFNIASNIQFLEKKRSIKILHDKVYKNVRKSHPNIKSCVIICAQKACLGAYKAMKACKHEITKPAAKKNPSIQLDHNLYKRFDNNSIELTVNNPRSNKTITKSRKVFTFKPYPKLQELLTKHRHKDPKLFVRNKKIYISFPFDLKPEIMLPQTKSIGIDLGIRRSAAISDGTLIIDKKFNHGIRELRHLKNELKSNRTKSSRRKLKRYRKKEHNKNNNQSHLLANMILKTDADTLVFEDLKGIKKKKNKFQNKRRIAQVPFYKLLEIVTYKALHQGKCVETVNPAFTSQTNYKTGLKDGKRVGCRYYTNNDGVVYDSDLNGSNNIVLRSKHPNPCICSALDGQAKVNRPIAYVNPCQGIASS